MVPDTYLQRHLIVTMSSGCRRLWLRHARQVVQVVSDGRKLLKGHEMNRIAVLERADDGDGISVIVNRSAGLMDHLYINRPRMCEYITMRKNA